VFNGDGLVCANAGHLPPLISRAGRPSFALGARGLPLGVECDVRYEEQAIELGSGDLLYAYTDGLTEARHQGEMFGEDRLRAALDDRRREAGRVDAIVESVHETVRAWAGGLVDDSTALAVQRR
jgi:serine phosphatase RsbU (regulator of sigma subunit)